MPGTYERGAAWRAGIAGAMLAILASASHTFAQAHPLSGPRVEPPEGYKLARGPFAVRVTDNLVLADEGRGKDLRLKVRVPEVRGAMGAMAEDAGDEASRPRYPLAIFSHGLGGSKDAFPDLCDHLASHGWVVVSPSHADSVQERRREGERVTRENAFDLRQMTPEARWERAADVTSILDGLDAIERDAAGLGERARVDRSRVALLGHSAGAHTTMLASGMRSRDRANPTGEPRPEKRVRASVVISGQGVNRVGIREDAWQAVEVPMLVITGSLDTSTITSETPATRRHPFEKSRGTGAGGPPVYLLWIEGATHSSYAGKETAGLLREKPTTPIPVIQDCVHSAVLAFLDGHVRGVPAGRAYLTGDGIKTIGEGRATLTAK